MNKSHIAFELDIDPQLIAHQSDRTSIRKSGGASFIHHYQPKTKVDLKQKLKLIFAAAARGKVDLKSQRDAEVHVTRLEYRFAIPESLPKRKLKRIQAGERIYKNTKPDITDNLNKLLFDAMSKTLFFDDSRVVTLNNVSKFYSLNVGISVELTIEWE